MGRREESIVEGRWIGSWFLFNYEYMVLDQRPLLRILSNYSGPLGQEHLTSHSISLLLPKIPLPDVWMQEPSSDAGCLQSQRNIAFL